MVEFTSDNLSLKEISVSGQCFRMKELFTDEDGSHFEIIAADKRLLAIQNKNRLYFDCSRRDFDGFWFDYFDLGADYGRIISSIDKNDAYLTAAAKSCSGIRILRQDLWEMIITFIISQQNNIPRIKKCVERLCERFGQEKDGFFAFPKASAIAVTDEDALTALGMGYRAKYILQAARQVVCGQLDLEELREMDYETAKKRLLKMYGVGIKVAECICLFALHHIGAFPIDTHIKQVLGEHYPDGFPLEKYSGYAGILQQYMFYFELNG